MRRRYKLKKIVIEMTFDADVIEVPDAIEQNIEGIQSQFDKWIHNKAIEHKYWFYKDGKKYCPQFRGDAFVEYLNEIVLKDSGEKAKMVERYVENYDSSLKSIWF